MQDLQGQNKQLREQALRVELLASVADALVTSSRDLDTNLNRVAGLIADRIGDGCSIQVRSQRDEAMTAVGVGHRNPDALNRIREIARSPLPSHTVMTSHVLSTGEPLIVSDVSSE